MKLKLAFLLAIFTSVAAWPQTTVAPFLSSQIQLLDNNGAVCSGCLLDTFAAGTTNALVTYSESTGTTPNTNPIVLSSAGRATVYLLPSNYKFRLRSAVGVTLWSQDGINPTTQLSTFPSITDTGDLTLQQTTAATSGANQSSNNIKVLGRYWTGSADATETCNLQDVLGTGSNPTVAFTLTCSGSSGATTFSVVPNTSFSGSVTAASVGDSTGTPATTGFLRMQSSDQICWRNNANGANVCIAKTGAVGAIPADSLDNTGFPAVKEPEEIFSGPNPYYDPRVAGAKCDGTTDDTSAFNTAISAANSGGGGWVLVPAGKTCVIAGQLNIAQMKGVRLASTTGIATFNTPLPILKFTGTTSPLVDARSSQGLEFDHFTLQYTNAAFAGRVIDFEHVIASDTQNFRVHDMTITGTSTAKGAICLVCADQTDVGSIDGVSFFWALHAVEAINANIFRVSNSNFGSGNPGVGDITGDYITDLGNNSTIGPNNNFEMSTNSRAINCSTCGDNINLIQNTFNDFVAGYNAQMIVINSNSFNLIGNFVGTGPAAGTFVGSGAAVRGAFVGNTLGSWSTCWNFPSASSSVSLEISGNKYGTCTTFISLASPFIGSGRIVDASGNTTSYGVQAADSNAVYLTADWTCGTAGTVASCTAATIIGSGGGVPLTFTLPLVARSWTWECEGVVGQATAATLNQWNILTATNGATNVTANYTMNTAATTMTGGAVTDQTATTATFQIAPSWTLGGTGTKMPFRIWGRVEGASVSGTVLSLQLVAPTVADLVTIYRGTGCRIW